MAEKKKRTARLPIAQSVDDNVAMKAIEVTEKYRTQRHRNTLLAITACTGIIAWAAVKISDKPDWGKVVATICACVGGVLAGEYGFFRTMMSRFGRYTERTQGRVSKLEMHRNPSRSSTGLMPDGTDPPEFKI